MRRTYAYLDAGASAGRSYYRLRQVDQDGTATYSPVQAVTLGAGGPALYPNPALHGVAVLTGIAPGAGTARLAGRARPGPVRGARR